MSSDVGFGDGGSGETDVKAYRTAVFLQQLQREVGAVSGVYADAVNDALHRYPDPGNPRQQTARSGIVLRYILALETLAWIRLGVRRGDLDGELLAGSEVLNADVAGEFLTMEQQWSGRLFSLSNRKRDQQRLRSRDFATEYTTSHLLMSQAEWEYLRLIHFSTESEWSTRIEVVESLAESFAFPFYFTFSDAALDSLTWALSGPEVSGSRGFPSAWRITWLDDAADGHRPPLAFLERSRDRNARLQTARTQIARRLPYAEDSTDLLLEPPPWSPNGWFD